MADRKNQHYVPQFYLRRFSKNKKSIDIYLLDKDKFINNASICGQCARAYFYGKNLKMEIGLSALESTFSSAIADFCNQDFHPDHKSIHYLRLFISIQHARTAKMNDFMKESIRFGIQSMVDLYVDKNDLSEIIDDKPNVFVNDVVKMMVAQAIMYAPLLNDLGIHKLTNTTETEFLTCDNPVIVVNPMYGNEPGSIGIGLVGVQIITILSPKKAVFMYDKNYYSPLITGGELESNINDDIVIKNINSMVAFNAYDIIVKGEKVSEAYLKSLIRNNKTGKLKIEQVNELKDLGDGKIKQIVGTIPEKMPPEYSVGYYIRRYKKIVDMSKKRKRDPELGHLLKMFEEEVKSGNYKASEFYKYAKTTKFNL